MVENPERNVPIAVLGGTLSAAVIYIVSTNVIAGIVPNMDLANSTAPFGLAFSHMFNPTVGKIIMALMVMSCVGSLLGWQFTIAQVFKSSADSGFFPKIFSKLSKADAPVKGMLTIVVIQSGLSLMTISPSLNKQFNVLVNGGGDQHHPLHPVDGGAGHYSESGEGAGQQGAHRQYHRRHRRAVQLLRALQLR